MRKFLFVLVLFLSLAVPCALCADFLDADYNFINSAFDGIKPVTDKEFNDTINKLTPQPVENTFGAKLKTFLFGRKYGVEPQIQQEVEDFDIGGDEKAIQDLKNGIYYIRLLVSIVGQDGKIIPLGNYKIKEEKIDNEDMLVFYQGREKYGTLKLRLYNDDDKKEKHALTYSRVDIVSDEVVRIVYATFDKTQCALARIAK